MIKYNQTKGKDAARRMVMIMLRTLESLEEITIGMEVRFTELWDGNGDGEELLQSGAISPDNENVVAFEVIEEDSDILNTLVRVTDIY